MLITGIRRPNPNLSTTLVFFSQLADMFFRSLSPSRENLLLETIIEWKQTVTIFRFTERRGHRRDFQLYLVSMDGLFVEFHTVYDRVIDWSLPHFRAVESDPLGSNEVRRG